MAKEAVWMTVELRGGPLHGKVVPVTTNEDVYVRTMSQGQVIYRRRYSGQLAGIVFDFQPQMQAKLEQPLRAQGPQQSGKRVTVELIGGPFDGEFVLLDDDDERIECWNSGTLSGQYMKRPGHLFEWEGA